MAVGDPYFTCDNKNESAEQAIRDMIYDDGTGKPVWTTNTNTALQKWFNCAERKNLSTEQVIKKMIVLDANNNPQWNLSNA